MSVEREPVGFPPPAVKPPSFEYHAPGSLDEALAIREATAGESVVLAGGQSLLPILNLRLAAPAHVLDIGRLTELGSVTVAGDCLQLGACVRQRTVERSTEVTSACPLLAEALPWIGHPSTRNRGTIGGSVAHADPAAELPAVTLAVDARLVVASARSERTVAAADFFHGVMSTALEPDELLIGIELERSLPLTGTAFVEVARRHGDFALVGVAAVVRLSETGEIVRARLVLAGVDATPVRATDAETVLTGSEPHEAAFAEAAATAAKQIEPHGDLHASAAYRRHVAAVLVRRALELAARRALVAT